MSIRTNTKTKYMNAAVQLREVIQQDPRFNRKEFTDNQGIAANFISFMSKAGFIIRNGREHVWVGRDINHTTMQEVFDQVEAVNSSIRNHGTYKQEAQPTPEPVAANDPVQGTLDLGSVQPCKPADVSRADYDALERRVASLEQLLIRRGVA